MAENQLGGTRSFRRSITSADGTNIIEFLNCAEVFASSLALETIYIIERSFYLEAFSGAIYLPSLAQAPFPELYPEMNSAEKIAAMLKIEEEYPFL